MSGSLVFAGGGQEACVCLCACARAHVPLQSVGIDWVKGFKARNEQPCSGGKRIFRSSLSWK